MKNSKKPQIDYFDLIFTKVLLEKTNLSETDLGKFLNSKDFNEITKPFIEMKEKARKKHKIEKIFAKKVNLLPLQEDFKSNLQKRKNLLAFCLKLNEAYQTHRAIESAKNIDNDFPPEAFEKKYENDKRPVPPDYYAYYYYKYDE